MRTVIARRLPPCAPTRAVFLASTRVRPRRSTILAVLAPPLAPGARSPAPRTMTAASSSRKITSAQQGFAPTGRRAGTLCARMGRWNRSTLLHRQMLKRGKKWSANAASHHQAQLRPRTAWSGRKRQRKQTQVAARPIRIASQRRVVVAQLRQISWTWRHVECSSAPIVPQVTLLQRLQPCAKARGRGFVWRTSCAVRPRPVRYGRRNRVSRTATRASLIGIADQTVARTAGAPQLARICSAVASAQLRSAANSRPSSGQTMLLLVSVGIMSVLLEISGMPQARPCAWERMSFAAPGALLKWSTTAFVTMLAIRQLVYTTMGAATS